MKLKFIIPLLLLITLSCATPKKASKGKSETTEKGADKDKVAIKPYDKVITKDAKTDDGLFKVHTVKDDFFYEIPDSLFNREMLMVTRIAKTATNIGFGGGKTNTQVLRWEKKPNKVLLRVVSHQIFAADSLPIHEAVVNSNFEPVLFSFDIRAFNKDTTATVIEVNKLFETDVRPLGMPNDYREEYKITSLEKERSYIESIKSYPLNIESRHVKTYVAKEPPSNSDLGSISVEMNNSMVLLPKVPMKRRYFDERVGWFARGQTDYGLDRQESKTVKYLDRWRLEVRDEDMAAFERGELVVPKKQIVYYIDRATPVKWRKYIKEGIEDWQVAFEAAGFKEAIIAKDPPTVAEDPEWSPEDVRYSVVRYLASPIPNANGPHVSDPRSGEILESDINWYHNVMTLLRNWYFVQTAAVNPEARGVAFKDEIMGRLIRFVSSHEVGHTLGLPHNMGSSVAYPVDSLRSVDFTKKYGTAPSIMDYARFNYIAQPGDGDVALMPNIGVYDKYAIKWGYKPLPNLSAEAEKKTLDSWILEHAGDPMYRFGSQQRGVIDPSSQTEDLGDDAVKASLYGISNLKLIMPKLIEYTREDGKDYEDLSKMYDQVVAQFNRYMGHVAANIGGVYEYYKTYDQNGAVYTHVPKAKQEESMEFLQDQLFATPEWLIDEEIFNKIQFDGSIENVRQMQARTLENVLDFGRMARIIENESINGKDSYSLLEMMDDLRSGIFSELKNGKAIDTYRRNLQRAYVDRLEYLMTKEQEGRNRTKVDVNQSDIRSVARAELKTLDNDIRNAIGRISDKMSKIHLLDLRERINIILNPYAK
ncbi:zinc-dependent metalloprotease [Aequorivita echinoideorum]|uniref:Zinc-dependent metalloprotease n=1 Tax=Aequorivita echinoideorum TaxID=1549647 RepID=A0ABS5S5Q9_9FLAO|nr:zinc-dependent metalloprotease [Aequorivita echinoideorum]MBT0608554.1 zinc-dependent metalloprotease [Aequorivita echinoideorum]